MYKNGKFAFSVVLFTFIAMLKVNFEWTSKESDFYL